MFRMLVVVATLLLSLTVEGVPVSPTLPHYKLESWPVVPKGQSLGPVGCSAVCDVSQQVFVAQRGAAMDPVVIFSANGTMVGSWGKEHLQTPHGIRIRRSGGCEEIWVTDVALHVARRFNSAGELTATLGIPGINGSGTHPVQFSEPTDVAFTSQEMFIADGDAGINNRILVFDADRLHLIRVIGEKGSGPGQFFVPHSISVDALDRLWVADRNNARLQVLTPQGHYIGEWNCGWDISEPDNGQPFGIWHVGEVFAITDGKANHTLVVRPPPMTHDDIGSCHVEQILPHENGVAHLPAGDVQGNLYISEVGPAPLGAKVLKYDREA